MEQQQINNEKFQKWFDDYVTGFYGNDEFFNANIKLKDDHSRRVCDEMQLLAEKLNLPDDIKRTAYLIALLHDIGRFEQFKTYRTYRDATSVNHAVFGIEILRKEKTLDEIPAEQRRIIEKAIEYHNLKELPAGLDGDLQLFCKLLRDADKLDIFYVVVVYYKQYERDPEAFKLEIELPNTPGYTKKVLQDILAGRRVDYNELQNWNDMKLLQLSWVYDLNFQPALERLKQKGYLEMIISFLPETDDIKKVAQKVLNFVEKKSRK